MTRLYLILSNYRVVVGVSDHKRGAYSVPLEAPGYTNEKRVLLAFEESKSKQVKWAQDRRVSGYWDSFFYVHDPREAIMLSYLGCGIKQVRVNYFYYDRVVDEEEELMEGLVCRTRDWIPDAISDRKEVDEAVQGFFEFEYSLEVLDASIYPCVSILYGYLVPEWEGYPAKRQRELLELYSESIRQKKRPIPLLEKIAKAFSQFLEGIGF